MSKRYGLRINLRVKLYLFIYHRFKFLILLDGNFFFITDPAEITYFSMESNMLLVSMNQTVNCTISGNPEPDVTVFSNWTGTVFYSDKENSVVTINYGPASCEDTGLWICTGSNYLNKGVNTTQTFIYTVYCE